MGYLGSVPLRINYSLASSFKMTGGTGTFFKMILSEGRCG